MTMDDLIFRSAAIEAMTADNLNRNLDSVHDDDMKRAARAAQRALARLPAAQPERTRGKWIRHTELKNIYGGKIIECSVCGEKYVVQHVEDEKYCRNCGADMRGREDG